MKFVVGTSRLVLYLLYPKCVLNESFVNGLKKQLNMKEVILTALMTCCIVAANGVKAQTIKVKNESGFKYDKVIIYTERTEGRHIPPYDRIWGISYDTPMIQTDTIAFDKKIVLPGDGVYTLQFEDENYVSCLCYGINAKKTKELTLNRNNCTFLFNDANNRAKFPDGTLIKEPNFDHVEILSIVDEYVLLYFEFVNKTPYTIYAINPKLSDEENVRYSLFFSNPDLRFLSGESRKITVIDDRYKESFNDNPTLTLYFVGVDKDSKQVLFKHDVADLGADVLTLDEKNIEILDKQW